MEIIHRFKIDAKPEMIYSAIISPHGIHSWFGEKGSIASKVGDSHVLNYLKEGQPKTMELKIEKLELNKKVIWRCTKHEFDVWMNTILTFEINENGEFHFVHSEINELHKNTNRYKNLIAAWDYFMKNLKEFCESGESHPW